MSLPTITHDTDICIIGGGPAGLCAALAAARHGASVTLMQDRPVLGGNSSSEIRMHICGADRHNAIPNLRETGILEELRLENLYRNPQRSYSMWDTVLYEKAMAEPNLQLILNCSCQQAEVNGDRISSITGWQLTTQTYHIVRAHIYIDCSGDAVLAPLTGAAFRMGREARAEFGESLAPIEADEHTMGMTCMFQARRYETPMPFIPLAWAYTYERCEELPFGFSGHTWPQMGYWWIELGGMQHAIYDTEACRDELLKIVYGIWDHLKNHCLQRDALANWALDWVQFLPGKRESRRYVGAYILNQNDIASGGQFDDTVAYGGWTMDDHHPAGFEAVKLGAPATHWHPAPSPYGIPYRTLYVRDIANLMFAGRDASCTHIAMSSTRVMGTACVMGQAAGTAAAWAISKGIFPRDVSADIAALQQQLLADGCYLPGIRQVFDDLTTQAELSASQGDPEPVRDGFNRPIGDNLHGWRCCPGDWLAYRFRQMQYVESVTMVLDSALDQLITMSNLQQDNQLSVIPDAMPRELIVEGLCTGEWRIIQHLTGNYQRLVRLPVKLQLAAIRFTLLKTWGDVPSTIYAFYVN
ncbi:MAG: FAD-dependent oxidoreductase [Chloroflexi bacterium]|nr:FAD-dependent oxidoreductase [Chloroflexota bacterium]